MDYENEITKDSDDNEKTEGEGVGSKSKWPAIHKQALIDFKLCQDAESDNRENALDDLKFARLGEQWPEDVIRKRKIEGRPCMTYNRMPTFIRQVVNDGRQNKPAIKVHPADDEADPKTAEVINGLIRNIEYSSNSEVAYDTGLDFAASSGVGYWRVDVDYTHDDAFEMDIRIERISNPFSVFSDYNSTCADSSDWNLAFVVDAIDEKAFKKKYKGKSTIGFNSDEYICMPDDWRDGDKVIIAEYWTRKEVEKTLALLSDGRVVHEDWLSEDVPDIDGVTNGELLASYGVTVEKTRPSTSYKVCQYIINGAEVLEENEWEGRYIPLVPVYGEELNIEGKRHFRSLIRDAKDAQRNFNYWRTTTTELIALAPKAPFIGAVGQFDTDADKWIRANVDNVPYVEYDVVNGAPPPMRQGFAGVPAGALQEALNASDDMKSIIGIYDASLGARSNETSGRAINARKSESDTGTFHFIDNQARAIRHTGRIILDLIPHVYNQARIIRVMGIDKTPQNIPINQPLPPQAQGEQGQAMQGQVQQNGQMQQQQGQPVAEDGTAQIYDLTVGKYDLTVDVGASFQTKREEAAYGMTELVRAFPQAASVIAPRLAKAQDWPEADEIAKELEAMTPKGIQANPQLQQAQQQIEQMGQQLQQAQQQLQSMQADKSLEAQKLQIDQFNAETQRAKAMREIQPVQQAQEVINTDMSEAEKLQFDAEVKLALEDKKHHGAMELEMLKQRAEIAKSNTNEMMTHDENMNMVPNEKAGVMSETISALVQELAGLRKTVHAPRVLIRDNNGRAVGSRLDINE